MIGVKEAFQAKILETVAKAAEEGVDGREYGKGLDEVVDKKIGEGSSEKIQRGPLTNFLMEVVEGLWAEDLQALAKELDNRARVLRGEQPIA